MKFDIWIFFENLSRKFRFHYNRTRITGTLREDQYASLIISCSFLPIMRNISNKSCRENQNEHFMFSNFFFLKLCHFWDIVEKYCRVGPGHRWQCGKCALHAGYLRLQTCTVRICNTYCCYTATVAAPTHISVMLYVHCLPCVNLTLLIKTA